ncbi:unnamed protein product [Phytophthora lilii]|uniref:Unnamed protein product n=1 Tax=Phytophthora lilii TaxID=2077276 RepID=A0A9W6WUS2_9STRA|nr:unnamed protein product [Phytophthora lilii]
MPVHVLVVMEDQEPSGQNVVVPEADLNSSGELLAFLENEMITQDNVLVKPRVLVEESFKFRLVGRENAIDVNAQCFRKVIDSVKNNTLYRIRKPIPFCCGIPGLGKTRMLEEGGVILRDVVKFLDATHITSIIVSYSDGYSLHPVDKLMPIEASFSWRLLYRLFFLI